MPELGHRYSLGIAERLQLLSILPQEGNITSLRIVGDLRRELSFSEHESEAFKIEQIGERILWDDKAERPKEVQIGPAAMRLVVETLEKLSNSSKLSIGQVPLYERFVEGK
jgi:hypothetical protein